MRILVLTLRIPHPPTDGGALAMRGLLQHLTTTGHSVTLLALNTRKHHQPLHVLEGVVERILATEIDTAVQPLHALASYLRGQVPYNIQRFWSAEHATRLRNLLQTERFDIIQLEGVYLAQYLPAIRQMAPDTPVVLRAHNVEYEIWQRMAQHERNPLKRHYYGHLARLGKRWEQQHVNRFDGLLPITPRDAEQFRHMGYRGPVHVLPVGMDVPEAAPTLPKSPTVAWLGSLDWLPNRQGLEWLTDTVWPLVRAQVPGAELHIAGKNCPSNVMQWQKPGIIVHGEVLSAEQFLAQHPVVAVPLLAGGGMRVKVLEALALGRILVSTAIGTEGIPVLDGEHVLVADSPQAFAAALVRALKAVSSATETDPVQHLPQQARALVRQHYGWQPLLQALTEWYQKRASTRTSQA